MSQATKNLYIIDGSGYIFRAFHALPPLTRPDGTPVGAVLGFCNMILKFLDSNHIDYIVVVFDSARKNFRHDFYPEYKANRLETPPELIPQFSLIREACEALNIAQLELENYEADDLIATLCNQARSDDIQVHVVSSDKDLMQLIRPGIALVDPIKNLPIGPEEVMAKFGVTPDKVIDIQALAGDSSDNVPGVPGIGVKTAAELITQFGSLEAILEQAHTIKQPKRREALINHKEDALMSKRLVTLDDKVPLNHALTDFTKKPLDREKFRDFLRTQNFRNLLKKFEGEGHSAPQPQSVQAPKPAPVKPQTTYELIQDLGRLKAWCLDAMNSGIVAFDTETNSLNPYQADMVGFSLGLGGGRACYVPLQHKVLSEQLSLLGGDFDHKPVPKQIPLNDAIAVLKDLLGDPAVKVIGHNLKFDMLVIAKYDLEIASYDDTMVMSYDLYGPLHGHGMDELAQIYLGHTTITYDEVTKIGKSKVTFDYVPVETACQYAAEDADITFRLYELFQSTLLERQANQVYYTIDRPLVKILKDMEACGSLIDVQQLKDLSIIFDQRLTALESEVFAQAGHPFNIASPKQLGEVLFQEMGLANDGKKGKTGNLTTSAEVLEDLASQGHIIAEKVLEWRQTAKLKSTYSDSLPGCVNPKTGRVHTSYGLTITTTGRLSSSDPNLQNIPIRTEEGRRIRQAFIARPGYKIASLDYSQIELRLLAHEAKIPSLQEAFKKGLDIHASTASEVFEIPLDQVDKELRRKAKAINFGIIYGISAFGLARQLKIARGEAAQYIEAYFKKYPGINAFMEEKKNEARTHGFVETLFGRRCYIRGIADSNPALRGYAERQAVNASLQGTAADLIKRAMIQVVPALKEKSLRADMILQVHDELVFEVHEQDLETATKLIQKIMETAGYFDVPLVVDVGWGDNWDAAH